jgi:hypothetical protein
MRNLTWLLVLAIAVLQMSGCSQSDRTRQTGDAGTTANGDEDSSKQSKALEVGDPAPAFSLVGSDGKTYRLEDFKGRKAVVVAWFPKAFTGG